MPKNQYLTAMEKALLQIDNPQTRARARKAELARKRAGLKVAQDVEDIKAGRRNPIIEIFENMAGKYEDGGEAKNKPGSTFKPMDMGGDILNSYLEGIGNSKDTTVKGGARKPKPKKMAKGGHVSPRKAQGMMYGGQVRKKK
jgi:hypothetical protein